MTVNNFVQRCAQTALLCIAIAAPIAAEAGNKKVKEQVVQTVFDAEKRKKTKHKLGARFSYSVYAGTKFTGESNRERDDMVDDRFDEHSIYLGLVGRADLGQGVIAFAHGEAEFKSKSTKLASYGRAAYWTTKEAFVSFDFGQRSRITVGRMRFSDLNKWVADAAVDGIHYGRRNKDSVLEFAAFTGTGNISASYVMGHYGRLKGNVRFGALGLLEKDAADQRLHLAAYANANVTKDTSYALNVGAVFGDVAIGQRTGFGFDVRRVQGFNSRKLNPQLMIGFAMGSEGYVQSGIHSNKTYNRGQAQVHRYGYVFQPDLTNLAVGSLALGIRPSRKLSIDAGLHVYGQVRKSTTAPIARISGATTGDNRFLGAELSLVGAWRPSKKTKIEAGIGHFKPGSAYFDKSSATRIYLRLSANF